MRFIAIALTTLVNAELLFAQRVSFGFMGGTNLTRDFPSSYLVSVVHVDPNSPGEFTTFERYSDHHGFIAGLSIEVDLGKGLALEGNALRRQLQLKGRTIFPVRGMREEITTDIGTWEWPILMKYRMPAIRELRPFIEAGPSFRTRHYPYPSEPSQIGGTVGAGVEFRVGKFRVSPTFRYTRWQYDDVGYPRVDTKRDQIEFLTGISYATSLPSWKVGGRKLRFGFIGGAPLTPGLEQPSPPQRIEELTGYMGGLAVEVELNRHWSVEVNGLYRPFRADQISVDPQFGESRFEFTVLTWQFPMLGKYRFRPESTIRPLVEAGPSFRLSGNLNGYSPSRYGFTAGGGIDADYKALRIAPVLRYTRWAADSRLWFMDAATVRNQVEFLVSFTF